MSLKLDKANKFHKYTAGVCAGLANEYKLDVQLVRVLFVAGVIFWGIGPLLYLILWIILNEKS